MAVRFRDPARERGWQPDDLARRLAGILTGHEDQGEWQPENSKYQLGSANNAWLHPEPDDVFVLTFRLQDPSRDVAFARVLAHTLGVEILEPTAAKDHPESHYAKWWTRETELRKSLRRAHEPPSSDRADS